MGIEENLLRPSWIEIDLDALRSNVRQIKRLIGDKIHLIPVLKGNAYGCGLTHVVQALSGEDIYGFGVGNIYEAIEVRKLSRLPILLFGNTLPKAIPEIQRYGITPSVSDWDWVSLYSRHAQVPLPIFVKIDVGLNRLGVPYQEAFEFVENVSRLPNIRIEGIQTHIAGALPFAERGLQQFREIIHRLEARGFHIPIKLAAHSQLIVQLPSSWMNAVDPGKLIYGIVPFESGRLDLKPVFTKLASRIIHIKKPVMISIEKFDLIGVIPIGMADGLPSSYAKEGQVLIKGRRAPIIKIHAEHTRIDLGRIPDARIGDEVVVIGASETDRIDVYGIAKKCNVTESELLRALSRCLPAIYSLDGRFMLEDGYKKSKE